MAKLILRFIICASLLPTVLFGNVNVSSNKALSLSDLIFLEKQDKKISHDKERQALLERMSIRDASDKIFKGNEKVSVSEVPIIYKNGILFTYIGNDDDILYVSGSFINWQKKNKND